MALIVLLGGCTGIDRMANDHHGNSTSIASNASAASERAQDEPDPTEISEQAEPSLEEQALAGQPDNIRPPQPAGEASARFGRRAVFGPRVYQVQIAAYLSNRDAEHGLELLIKKAPDLLNGLDVAIVEARPKADRELYYRLRTPNFGTVTDAEAMCAALDAQKIDCFVVEMANPSRG